MKTLCKLSLMLLLVMAVSGVSYAETDYPSRAIKIVVPYAAGGADQFFAQMAAKYLTKYTGQNVLVEPRPGAGGNVGSAYVAKSDPDGYTLLAATANTSAINPFLFKNMPYDAEKETRMIAPLAVSENVLVVAASSPFKSVADVLAYGKANPGKLTYGSSGVGSVLHLSGATLQQMTGIPMTHIPYQGSAPALIDVIGGRLSMMFANAPTVISLIKGGKLRALAVTGKKSSESLPGVPTMEEAGVPGFTLVSWYGIMGPYNMPKDVIEKLNQLLVRMLKEPEIKDRFLEQGATPLIMGTEDSQKFFLDEMQRWGKIVKLSGAQVE